MKETDHSSTTMNSISFPLSERLDQVRKLGPEDRQGIEELIREHQLKFSDKGGIDVFLSYLHLYLDPNNERDVLFGFSQSHQIYSMIGIHLWTAMPYATLSYMIVRQSKKSFRVDENGLVYCLHKCFEYGETFGIKAYYSLQKYRGIRHKRRSWRQYDTPLTSRYYSLLEYRVEAHHRPQHSIIYELMDKRTWPHPVGIWCTRLKPKYENLINWGD